MIKEVDKDIEIDNFKLINEFGKGFSIQNLRRMRHFILAFLFAQHFRANYRYHIILN